MQDPNCPFCKILAGEEPATIHSNWDDTIIITPLNPVTSGHRLAIPIAHVTHPDQDLLTTALTFARAAQYAGTLGCDYNLIVSSGPIATQTVSHLHVHIVPRYPGDGLRLPWTGQLVSATTGKVKS
jgi:histidine triad (HIT) family protein